MTGAEIIAAERDRQITEEGWTPDHDARRHVLGELVAAAICYATVAHDQTAGIWTRTDMPYPAPNVWPWSLDRWRPSPWPERNLAKAGALIAAELDRSTPPDDAGDTVERLRSEVVAWREAARLYAAEAATWRHRVERGDG
jgi:hypothetical protein